MKKCSVIILNYKTGEHVEKLLASMIGKLDSPEYEIIVADNSSNDDYLRGIESSFPYVKFMYFDTNDGFASGNNRAAGGADGEYLLFLNPDIILKDDSVKRLIDFLSERPDCGIVSGLLENEQGEAIYCYNDYPGFAWELYHLLGTGYDGKIRKLLQKPEISAGSIFETDWFHGAFLLMRKNDFVAAGKFNEKYFMYYEDVELCYRMKKGLGKKIVCLPDVRVIHDTRASLRNEGNDNLYTFHINRGKLIFLGNFSFAKKILLSLISFAGIVIRILVLPVWGKYKGVKKNKLKQLAKVFKLYVSKRYLSESKYEYITK